LQGVGWAFPAQIRFGDGVQAVINRWRELLESGLVALAPLGQQLGNIRRRRPRVRMLSHLPSEQFSRILRHLW